MYQFLLYCFVLETFFVNSCCLQINESNTHHILHVKVSKYVFMVKHTEMCLQPSSKRRFDYVVLYRVYLSRFEWSYPENMKVVFTVALHVLPAIIASVCLFLIRWCRRGTIKATRCRIWKIFALAPSGGVFKNYNKQILSLKGQRMSSSLILVPFLSM